MVLYSPMFQLFPAVTWISGWIVTSGLPFSLTLNIWFPLDQLLTSKEPKNYIIFEDWVYESPALWPRWTLKIDAICSHRHMSSLMKIPSYLPIRTSSKESPYWTNYWYYISYKHECYSSAYLGWTAICQSFSHFEKTIVLFESDSDSVI